VGVNIEASAVIADQDTGAGRGELSSCAVSDASATPPRVLAVVPARGGSRGLPGKNVRPLGGLPLIGHSLRAAELVPAVTRCIVSTESDQIAAVARSLGGDVPFLRPPELATDETPIALVLRHALVAVEEKDGEPYEYLVLLEPTSPARNPVTMAAALDLLGDRPDLDGVISVSAPTFHPVWVGVREASGDPGRLERYFPDSAGVTRRQQLDRYLRINGNFYVWRADFVRRMEASWFDEGAHGFIEIPESLSFSIDYLEEFELLEWLIADGHIRLPWLNAD
jgi:CMP-N,N'-diacetyllegionaminic acid synthase